MNNYQWYPYADLVLKNANIYTVDLTISEIQSGKYDFTIISNGYIAIKDGKIISVGEGMDESFIGPETHVEDVEGKTVIPGLVDSHMHAMFAGMDLQNVALKDCKTLDEMLGLLKERAEKVPEGSWIKGAAWNELNWTDGKKPDRYALDSVSTKHAIFAKRLCCHVIVANSMALKLAGITKDTPDPDGGIIGRDENGEPNGWLYENSAMDLIEKVFPPLTEAQLIDSIEGIGKYINSVGITTVIDA
ncbi:MAG: amidohydrolase family protein, partial [Roseburia faecis]|nr:amidohydrolase family protein [Roseburia faecis]